VSQFNVAVVVHLCIVAFLLYLMSWVDDLDNTWGTGYSQRNAYDAFTRYGQLAARAGTRNILRHAIRNPPRQQRGAPPHLLYPAARIGRAIAYSPFLQRARQRIARRRRTLIMQNRRMPRSALRHVNAFM